MTGELDDEVAGAVGRRWRRSSNAPEWYANIEAVEWQTEPPARVGSKLAYTWQPSGDGATHMTLRNRGEPSGFSKLAEPFMTTAIRRANRKDLAALRRILESR